MSSNRLGTIKQQENPLSWILKQSIDELNVSYRQLADLLDISESSLRRYAKNQQIPRMKRAIDILEALELDDDERKYVIRELEPQSISADIEGILEDMVIDGFNPDDIFKSVSFNGYAGTKDALSYHINKVRFQYGLVRKKSLEHLQKKDSIDEMIDKILRNDQKERKKEKILRPKNSLYSDLRYNFEKGNLLEDFLRIYFYSFKVINPDNLLQQYALTIEKDGEGNVIRTTDIVDMIHMFRNFEEDNETEQEMRGVAYEIKTSCYDAKAIYNQLVKQKNAILALHKDPENNPIISKVKELKVLIPSKEGEFKNLEELIKGDDFISLESTDRFFTSVKYVDSNNQSIKIPGSRIPNKEFRRWIKKNGMEYRIYHFRPILKKIIGKRIQLEDFRDIRYNLDVFETYMGNIQGWGNIPVGDYFKFIDNLWMTLDTQIENRDYNPEAIHKLFTEQFGIKRIKPTKHDSMTCFYEENGELKTIKRRIRRNFKSFAYKSLARIWGNMGKDHDEFEINEPNLEDILRYQQKIEPEEKEELTAENLKKLVPGLNSRKKQTYLNAIAKKYIAFKPAFDGYSHWFEEGYSKRIKSITESSFFPSFARILYSNLKGLVKSYSELKPIINLYRKIITKHPGVAAAIESEYKGNYNPFKVFSGVSRKRRLLIDIENGLNENINAFFSDVSNQLMPTGEIEEYFSSVLNSIEPVIGELSEFSGLDISRVVRALSKTPLDPEERGVIGSFVCQMSNLTELFIAKTIYSTVERCMEIMKVNKKLGLKYLDLSLGECKKGEEPKYHRILNPREHDSVYESICKVYTGLSRRGRLEKLKGLTGETDLDEGIEYLTFMSMKNKKFVDNLFGYLDKNNYRKADVALNLNDEAIENIDVVNSELAKADEKDLYSLGYSIC